MFFQWLNEVRKREHWPAIRGSLERRILRKPYLEMVADLSQVDICTDSQVTHYSHELEDPCIHLLNSVATLDFWNVYRFQNEIKLNVKNALSDVFLFMSGNEVLGFMVLHEPDGKKRKLPEVGYVAVLPRVRNQKIGTRLLAHVMFNAKSRGYAQVTLKTDFFRIPAIKLYLKMGFAPIFTENLQRKKWEKLSRKIDGEKVKKKR